MPVDSEGEKAGTFVVCTFEISKNWYAADEEIACSKNNQVTVCGLRACDFLTVSAAAASISLPYRLASYVLLAKKTSEVIFNVLI